MVGRQPICVTGQFIDEVCCKRCGYMHIDVEDLSDFYNSRLGLLVRRRVSAQIRTAWQGRKFSCLTGLGFATPFLPSPNSAARVLALMPEGQGALVWPRAGNIRSALVREDKLPLPDNSVDQCLVAHCLEVTERPRTMLREIWRVLTPEGRVTIIVPNRRGVWCRLDHTPFGQGSPFSRNQLARLLRQSLLTPEQWSHALYFPPVNQRLAVEAAPAIERVGGYLGAAFAGVLIVEARKELTAPEAKQKAVRVVRGLVPVRESGGRL